jgi:hypothetical protein
MVLAWPAFSKNRYTAAPGKIEGIRATAVGGLANQPDFYQ